MDLIHRLLSSDTGSILTSRTVWLNAAAASVAVFMPEFEKVMSPEVFIGIQSVVNIVLRKLTKMAI